MVEGHLCEMDGEAEILLKVFVPLSVLGGGGGDLLAVAFSSPLLECVQLSV